MCGIYGVWQRGGSKIDAHRVLTATTTISHRGPDDEGYLLVDSASEAVQPCRGPDTTRLSTIHT